MNETSYNTMPPRKNYNFSLTRLCKHGFLVLTASFTEKNGQKLIFFSIFEVDFNWLTRLIQ